jgi:menaquinol-cytochrome c reductase iron-sulfur subunit
MENDAPAATASRRSFLGWVIGGLGALCGLIVGLPVIGSLGAPAWQRRREGQWIDFGSIENLPLGAPRQLRATFQARDGWYVRSVQQAVWVIRTDEQHYTVFHPRCTHLGCAYRWEAEKREFACPCHGGRYDITGRVIGGPPPRSLDTLTAKVEGGKLFVQFV